MIEVQKSSNIDCNTPSLGRAMAQAVSRRPLTWEAGFAPESIHVGFVVDRVVLGQVFLRVLRISPVSIIPPSLQLIDWEMNSVSVSGSSSET
jgi:hypothetical protein